ncbi:MAG: hypothetical protein L0Z68_03440 [Gammaproteobacteria bacterium]|nr:hypothetical protein [Gammaproteobacteria bacterium]
MKRADIDWSILRGAVTVFALCLLVSSVMLAASIYFRDEMESDFNKDQTRFHSISRKYLAIDEEDRLIKQFYPRFKELYAEGIIGNEQRLNWIETLRDAEAKIELPLLSYEITSQNEYTPSYGVFRGGFQIYASKMELTFGLSHEGDLERLLDELNKRASGLYSVGNCTFTRSQKTIEHDPQKPNISGTCELLWYTIKLSDGRELVIS